MDGDEQTQLLTAVKRRGNIWSAMAHIITGVIGAGVLSMAWSLGQLGWLVGPITLVIFGAATLFTTFLQCDCYKSQQDTRNPSYISAVRSILGEKPSTVSSLFVLESLYGCGVAYTITAAISARAIQKSNCYHKQGHGASCGEYGDKLYMLLFGGIQIVMSQIPDFHNMRWLSFIAALMSFTYSSIGLALGIAYVIGNGKIQGSIAGITATSPANKLWLSFQALGDIAFAYPYSVIVLEIQDTLKSPPEEKETMKKASMYAILITTFFYICCACFGYAAFGEDTPGNLLTGFGFYEPFWLIDFANACIVLHLVGGYQVYCQPVFAAVEQWFVNKFTNSAFVNHFYKLNLSHYAVFRVNLFRLCFRTTYVVSITGISIVFPYFNEVLGVLGALNLWPIGIYFPVEMYLVQSKIDKWTKKWVSLQIFSSACLLVSIVALIGSLEGLTRAKLSSQS